MMEYIWFQWFYLHMQCKPKNTVEFNWRTPWTSRSFLFFRLFVKIRTVGWVRKYYAKSRLLIFVADSFFSDSFFGAWVSLACCALWARNLLPRVFYDSKMTRVSNEITHMVKEIMMMIIVMMISSLLFYRFRVRARIEFCDLLESTLTY